jgi:hypothetical protein
MCTKFGNASPVEKKTILDRVSHCKSDMFKTYPVFMQWTDAWDPANHYLAEKSPQNMLKIPFLDSVFSDAQKRKYVIVIKVIFCMFCNCDKLFHDTFL